MNLLDDRRRAEAWKKRALDAERQRDLAESEVAAIRAAMSLIGTTLADLMERTDTFLFGAAHP